MIRISSALIRVTALTVPVVLIGWQGVSYIVSCLDVLQAPGVPLRLSYQSPNGSLTFIAKSYALDWRNGNFQLASPSIIDPSQRTLVSADRIIIDGLNAVYGANQIIHARVGRVDGVVRRLSTGRFEIEDFLPKKEGPPSTIPFEVSIGQINLTYEDRFGGSLFTKQVQAGRTRVTGIGDDWIASSKIAIADTGTINLAVQSIAEKGIEIAGSSSGLEVADVVRHLARPSMAGRDAWEARSIRIVGPWRAYLPKDRGAQVDATLSANVRDLRYKDYFVDQAHFDGLVTSDGARGRLKAKAFGSSVVFDGSGRWSDKIVVGGEATIEAPATASLPSAIRRLIPEGLHAGPSRFRGWLGYRDGALVSGRVGSSWVRYSGEQVRDIAATVVFREKSSLQVDVQRASYNGQTATAHIVVDPGKQRIEGIVNANRLNLASLSNRFSVRGFSGNSSATAFLGGSLRRPSIDIYAKGVAYYRPEGMAKVRLGDFEISGAYLDGRARVDRGFVFGPAGSVRIIGRPSTLDVLSVDLDARGLLPGLFVRDLRGSANVRAHIGGSVRNPFATGRIEAYDTRYRNERLPVVAADFNANRREVRVSKLSAVRGASTLQGEGRFRFASRTAEGTASINRVQLAEWLGDDVVGLVDVPSVHLTYANGELAGTGTVRGSDVVAYGSKIDGIQLALSGVRSRFTLTTATAQVAGGEVIGDGNFDLHTMSGNVSSRFRDLDLSQLSSRWSNYFLTDGRLNGQLQATINKDQIEAEIEGSVDQMQLNGTMIGNGQWRAEYKDGDLGFNASVGILTATELRAFEIENGRYDLASKDIDATVYAKNLDVEELISVALYSSPQLKPDQVASLRTIGGSLNLGAHIFGDARNPDFSIETAQISGLKYGGQDFGILTAAAERKGPRWTVKEARLDGEPGLATLTGWLVENGEVSADLEVSRLLLPIVSKLVPSAPSLTGTVRMALNVSGSSRSPVINGDLSAEKVFSDELQNEQGLGIILSRIAVNENDGAQIEGFYNFEGLTGSITATAPFRYSMNVPDGLAEARITLAKREISSITALSSVLDLKQSTGAIEGEITARYDHSDITAKGELRLDASQLAFRVDPSNPLGISRIDDRLKNVKASVQLDSQRATVSLSADNSRGGSIQANAQSVLPELSLMIDSLRAGGSDALLDSPLTGELVANDLAFRQRTGGSSFISGKVKGALSVTGTVRSPSILGGFTIANLDTVVPSFTSDATPGAPPLIDPSFDLALSLANAAHVRSAGADLSIVGGGSLTGKLSKPVATADFSVQKGNIRLPGGNLRVDPGGSLEFSYHNTANSVATASLGVDMRARTSMTSSQNNGLATRYDVTIGVSGDLLKEDGLNLSASSDPPDLSQGQILAMLGRTDILESIGSGNRDTKDRVQEALVGYALPSLFDPYTSEIAATLGLEYLTLEYSRNEQASFAFGKSLGLEFSVQVRRQLGEPAPGVRPLYDLRLVYAPKTILRRIPRLNFSFGADQDRPWKVAVEYGFRFGSSEKEPAGPPVVISSSRHP